MCGFWAHYMSKLKQEIVNHLWCIIIPPFLKMMKWKAEEVTYLAQSYALGIAESWIELSLILAVTILIIKVYFLPII